MKGRESLFECPDCHAVQPEPGDCGRCPGVTKPKASDSLFPALSRTVAPAFPEPDWYDRDGQLIVTNDDRFHGYAKPIRELVESLSCWNDPALWMYRLDLLSDAIERERYFAGRAENHHDAAEAVGRFLRGESLC